MSVIEIYRQWKIMIKIFIVFLAVKISYCIMNKNSFASADFCSVPFRDIHGMIENNNSECKLAQANSKLLLLSECWCQLTPCWLWLCNI